MHLRSMNPEIFSWNGPYTEAMLIRRPRPLFIRRRVAAWVIRKVPFRLTPMTWSHSWSFIRISKLSRVIPALACSRDSRYRPADQVLERIGNCRIVEEVASGGMAVVYRAVQDHLGRTVAIKALKTSAAAEQQTVVRFEREAQATAALQSYHTINLYDFGVSDEGSFYYVMELLDGLNLDVFVKRFGPVSADRAVFWLRQACHSLGEAHEKGMIHRDIKPANIYVCRMGQDYDFVKVLDFGLVKSSQSDGGSKDQLTLRGVVTGTPGFMAPEMALGDGTVDGRADIYSLGCVGYWLVTGRLVFEADTPLSKVVHHIQSKPIPPSEKSELEIPKALEDVILRCLEKDPDARPQDVWALDRLLAGCDGGQGWTNEKAKAWWELHFPV